MNHNDLIALMNTGGVPMKIINEQGEKKSAGSPVAPAALHVSPAVLAAHHQRLGGRGHLVSRG